MERVKKTWGSELVIVNKSYCGKILEIDKGAYSSIHMHLRKFIVEMGMGIDQHGQDPTNAARKAVKDAVSRSCLCGIVDVARLDDVDQMVVEILVACPHPDRVDPQKVLQAVPFGQKRITVVEGGMVAPTI